MLDLPEMGKELDPMMILMKRTVNFAFVVGDFSFAASCLVASVPLVE